SNSSRVRKSIAWLLIARLQSQNKIGGWLVDVAGIEPATPCLQILGARKMSNLQTGHSHFAATHAPRALT
ncbi:MAG: hypothetical protein WA185_07505, partial [Candidatus Acidiferrales bacterium]